MSAGPDATQTLLKHLEGDPSAAAELIPLVYDELRALAAQKLRAERSDHTLAPTALVHEAFARLIDGKQVDWNGRTHFFAVSADTIRRVLIDHARARKMQKRAGDRQRITLDERVAGSEEPLDLLELDDALTKLENVSPRQAQVVKLRFFGGLGVEEVASILEVSTVTVKTDWRVARAWLKSWMQEGDEKDPDAVSP